MARVATSERVYAGLTTGQREERRREQLLAGGLEVFGTVGWERATVRHIAQAAGVSPRYFYAHFASRQELFLAVCDEISADVRLVVRAAATHPDHTPPERVHDVLGALADYFERDPRTIRVALVESMCTPELRAYRSELLGASAALAAGLMRSIHPSPADADTEGIALSAAVLSGGIAEILVAATTSRTTVARDGLVRHLTRLYTAAATLDVHEGR